MHWSCCWMAKIVDRRTAWNSAGADSREECHKIGSDGHWERQGILFFFCSPLRYSQFKDIPFFQSCLQAYTTQATGARAHTTGLKHLLKTSSMSIFAFTPREKKFCNPNRLHRCHWLQLAITLFPVDWFPSSAIHCNRSTSVPIYCHLSFYIVTIAFTSNKLPYNQYNYYVIYIFPQLTL